MAALLELASCMAYGFAKAPIWGINHVVIVLIQIFLFALDFLAFVVVVGWMTLDGVALLLDAGYDVVTMGSSAALTVLAALCTKLSSPKACADVVQKIPKTVTVYVLVFAFSTIEIVESLFMMGALVFEVTIITRAFTLVLQTFTSCFSLAIAPASSPK